MRNKAMIAASILAVLFLSACSPKIVYVPKEVFVPVATECPKPPVIPQRSYPVDQLTEADKGNYQKIAEAYSATVKMMTEDNKDLNKYLDVYRNHGESDADQSSQPTSEPR